MELLHTPSGQTTDPDVHRAAPQGKQQPRTRAERQAALDRSPRTTVQLERDLSDEIDKQAALEGTTRAALTRKAVRYYLDQAAGIPTTLQVVSLVSAGGPRHP